jgi:hypothetical protein
VAITLAVAILFTALEVGILLTDLARENEVATNFEEEKVANSRYTYSLSPYHGNGKIYIVTVETNWTSKPKVSLPAEYDTLKYVSVVFTGWSRENVFFNVTIPTDLLWGNISLFRKYYEQPPEVYTLSNNGTHNSIGMTCVFTPYFSGVGYFAIRGTEAAW